MYRRLATLIVKAGLTTGIALLLTLETLMPSAAHASAAACPVGTVPIIGVDGDPQCVALEEGGNAPEPEVAPTPAPTPSPTRTPTEPAPDPGTAPPEEPVPTAVPEATLAVIVPPPVTAPTLPEVPPAGTPVPVVTSAPTLTERSQTPDETSNTSTPTPAVIPPALPVNADTTGVILSGDGPRLFWAVAAGASASGLLAAIVAFYLVSIRPFLMARRRPGAVG